MSRPMNSATREILRKTADQLRSDAIVRSASSADLFPSAAPRFDAATFIESAIGADLAAEMAAQEVIMGGEASRRLNRAWAGLWDAIRESLAQDLLGLALRLHGRSVAAVLREGVVDGVVASLRSWGHHAAADRLEKARAK